MPHNSPWLRSSTDRSAPASRLQCDSCPADLRSAGDWNSFQSKRHKNLHSEKLPMITSSKWLNSDSAHCSARSEKRLLEDYMLDRLRKVNRFRIHPARENLPKLYKFPLPVA